MAYNVVNLPKITVNIKKWSNIGFKTKIVDELPETGEEGIIYLLSARKSSSLIQKTSTTYAIPLATVQTDTSYKKDFTVDNITGIKAGMTLRFIANGTMGYATVESVTINTKTVTMTNPVSLSTGTLVFDNATWSHDSYNEYIWNITNGSFEKLGLIDLNVQSKAIAQSIVGRDWNGRAQVENPSEAKDIANKGYVDNAVSDKITMGDLMGAISGKLDTTALGNFTFDTDTLKNDNISAEVILGNTIGMPDKITISQKGINRDDVVHSNAGSWSILDGNVQAFSSDANPVMKETSLFNIINSSEKTDVIDDNYGAVIKRDKLGLTNTFMGKAATLTIANLEVLSNGETKSETLENIIEAPSKIANKQDTLVSGTNIKTINGESVLGEGNITITPSALTLTSPNGTKYKITVDDTGTLSATEISQ